MIRIIAALSFCGCLFLGYESARLALADFFAHQGSRAAISRAVTITPTNPDYYVTLSELDPPSAASALDRAAALSPANSSLWLAVAATSETYGDFSKAESALLHAIRLDRTFAPRWSLAQFYFRRRDNEKFWPAVKAALTASYDDASPLFDLCWTRSPDPLVILERAIPERPAVLRQYFDFLIARDQLDAADAVAGRLLKRSGPDMLPSMLAYDDRLLQKDDVERALRVWNALAGKHLIDYPSLDPAVGLSLTNGLLAKPFLGRGFDWRLYPQPGIYLRRTLSPALVRFDFSGSQLEFCELLTQFVPVSPRRQYRLAVRYSTDNLSGTTGLAWSALAPSGGTDLLAGAGRVAATDRRGQSAEYSFSTPPQTRLVRLVLAYRRASGTVRIEGSLSVSQVDLRLQP
ncbi:MAG: hypothetical protein U0Q18_09425 [Bryobacteraceae bacterium]